MPRTALAAPSSLVPARFASTFPAAVLSIGLAMCDSSQAAKTPSRGGGLARWVPGVEQVFWPTLSLRRLSQRSNVPERPKILGFMTLSVC
jgi:hypothetical protein